MSEAPGDGKRSRAPSIRDVAKLAGVSHQTVSRVLNNHPSIRDETKARVLEVMDQLQYRPNRAARALVTSRSRTIGVLTSSRSEYGPASSIQAIEEAALDAGYLVITANADGNSSASIARSITHLLNQSVEGMVVIAPQVRVFDTIAEMRLDLPFVTLQSSGRLNDHSLSVDQISGARMATRHLIELGHRGIYHLAGPQDWIEAEARMEGFLREMSDNDVPTTAPILGDWTAEFGYHAGRELLRVRDFTAIFSSNDQMALGLVHAIRDAGLDVPRDISVVGFDDIPEAAHFWPPLTTVRQDFAELGRRAIAVLVEGAERAEAARSGASAGAGGTAADAAGGSGGLARPGESDADAEFSPGGSGGAGGSADMADVDGGGAGGAGLPDGASGADDPRDAGAAGGGSGASRARVRGGARAVWRRMAGPVDAEGAHSGARDGTGESESGDAEASDTSLPTSLVVRSSTAPPAWG
jgi:DNA-binding LacI/PurR family transcriptional regulator